MTKSVFKTSHLSPTLGCVAEGTKASETYFRVMQPFLGKIILSTQRKSWTNFNTAVQCSTKIAVLNWQCKSAAACVKPTYFVLIIDGEQCRAWVVHEWETARVAHALGHGFESMQQMWTPNW